MSIVKGFKGHVYPWLSSGSSQRWLVAPGLLEADEIVPVHDFTAVLVAQRFLDAVRAQAADARDVFRAVVGDAIGDAPAVGIDHVYGVATREGAAHVLNAGR